MFPIAFDITASIDLVGMRFQEQWRNPTEVRHEGGPYATTGTDVVALQG